MVVVLVGGGVFGLVLLFVVVFVFGFFVLLFVFVFLVVGVWCLRFLFAVVVGVLLVCL